MSASGNLRRRKRSGLSCNLNSRESITYCKKYLGDKLEHQNGDYERKTTLLIEKFCEVESNISYEPFLAGKNKNPKPDVIKTIFSNFGLKDVFSCLHDSKLDEVVNSTPAEVRNEIQELKEYLKTSVQSFPYSCSEARLNMQKCSTKLANLRGSLHLDKIFSFLSGISAHAYAASLTTGSSLQYASSGVFLFNLECGRE